MDKVTKICLSVGIIAILILTYAIYLEATQRESYSINQYSCEQIGKAINDDNCLISSRSPMFRFCHEDASVLVYYIDNCGKLIFVESP